MMGVYIKGMEMPKRGHTTTITIVGSGQAYVEYFDCRPHVKETIEYEAVPVPPHGRLIDADKLCELCGIMADNSDDLFKSIWNQFKTTVEWCPTIIPTEEGE